MYTSTRKKILAIVIKQKVMIPRDEALRFMMRNELVARNTVERYIRDLVGTGKYRCVTVAGTEYVEYVGANANARGD
jgi:hypothetical protein